MSRKRGKKRRAEQCRQNFEAKLLRSLLGTPRPAATAPPKPRPKEQLARRPRPLGFKPQYQRYINSDLWRRVRLWKIGLVGGKCEKCSSDVNLQVHHLTYDRLGAERAEDLQVLCKPCHERAHGLDLTAKAHLKAIANES